MGKLDLKRPKLLNKNNKKTGEKTQKNTKIRIPSWDSPGVQDQHSGMTLPRRRPKNAKHDGQMGQISNEIIDKNIKNAKKYKKNENPLL